ncbi:hypothetical protein [Cyclobacterium amurskyense]|uniref:Uncharacterized protein n=1 Tax=Cyclobacterium amurskyense TaxID=320787 RepID=A0A0H4P769_9BACT|nr:hypothetical protein [Cyclobacterium amurskyense]AKP49994.1 hypothetical protein CA2015_0527 [Cyclobacterium amurskyense]
MSALLQKNGNNAAKIKVWIIINTKGWHPWLIYCAPVGLGDITRLYSRLLIGNGLVVILSALLQKNGNNAAKIKMCIIINTKGWHPWLIYCAPLGLGVFIGLGVHQVKNEKP